MAIVIIRTIIIYFALLCTMRLLGKRQLGELELSEFVLGSLIADLASHPLQDVGIPMTNGLVPIAVLFCCEIIISWLSLKSVRLRSALFGKPSILIYKGKINQSELRRNRFMIDELAEELRGCNVTDISTVEYAILETCGKLNVILFPEQRPLTSEQMNIKPEDTGLPVTVISDGRLLEANLKHTGHDISWLKKELQKRNVSQVSQVFFMSVDELGKVYFTEMEEK